uniref:7TM_GPCR_Srx domain-containing protein n=1 Tax=Strongyloides papillosus TaxID=174720 RepID=A0A0N5CI53_STREA
MIIVFASEYAYRTFYDCSFFSEERWWEEGKPSLFYGLLYIICGSFFMVLYIPIGLMFLKRDLLKLTCYKFMFQLFIVDEICLIGCSTFSGVMAIKGAVFCNYPRLSWIIGMTSISGWGSCCSMCVFMAFNRCLEIVKPRINTLLFHGYKAYIWMGLSLCYGFFIGTLNGPMFFSSKTYGWYYDPYYGTNLTGYKPYHNYTNYPHVANNFLVVILLTTLYSYFCIKVMLKFKTGGKFKITKLQKSLLLQSSILCTLNFAAAIFYIYVQYNDSPFLVIVGKFFFN